jgi:hypothetical protein
MNGSGDRLDRERGHQPHVLQAPVLEHAAHQDPVHHRAEHPDVVGLGTLDRPVVGDVAAEEVPSADHDRLLDAEDAGGDQLIGDVSERVVVQAEVGGTREGAPAQLDDDPAIAQLRHGPQGYRAGAARGPPPL